NGAHRERAGIGSSGHSAPFEKYVQNGRSLDGEARRETGLSAARRQSNILGFVGRHPRRGMHLAPGSMRRLASAIAPTAATNMFQQAALKKLACSCVPPSFAATVCLRHLRVVRRRYHRSNLQCRQSSLSCRFVDGTSLDETQYRVAASFRSKRGDELLTRGCCEREAPSCNGDGLYSNCDNLLQRSITRDGPLMVGRWLGGRGI